MAVDWSGEVPALKDVGEVYAVLGDRERAALRLQYGLDGADPLDDFSEVARHLRTVRRKAVTVVETARQRLSRAALLLQRERGDDGVVIPQAAVPVIAGGDGEDDAEAGGAGADPAPHDPELGPAV